MTNSQINLQIPNNCITSDFSFIKNIYMYCIYVSRMMNRKYINQVLDFRNYLFKFVSHFLLFGRVSIPIPS